MQEAANDYKIDFGPYSVELKGNQVYFRKNNSLMKAMPVKSTFGLYDLKKLVKKVAASVNMTSKLPKDVLKAEKEDSARDLLKGVDESTKEWTKTIKKLAKQDQLKKITSKDKETLLKIVRMMKTANEAAPEFGQQQTAADITPVKVIQAGEDEEEVNEANLKQYTDKQLLALYKTTKDPNHTAANAYVKALEKELKKRKVKIEGKLAEDYVKSGHMYHSLTYKVQDQQKVYDAYKKFKQGNRTLHLVATNKGDTVTFSGHPQKGYWMAPSIADQLDAAVQKTGKAKLVKSDSKKLKENKMTESEKKFRKIIREMAEPMLKEADEYVVIDPRGNSRPAGMRMQASQYVKKMGGAKKGYFMILKKNALKARRALEKARGNYTDSKFQDKMSDMYWEGKTNENLSGYTEIKESTRTDLQLMQAALKGIKAARVGNTAGAAYLKSLKNSWRINKDQKEYKDWTTDDWEEDVLHYIQNKG